jgi:hypothetical protein
MGSSTITRRFATSWLDGATVRTVAGFTEYLRAHVAPARLNEAGVEDLGGLNYRDFVRQWMEAHPSRHAEGAPLGDDYRVYQYRAAEAFLAELRALAEKTAGRPLTFAANAGLPSASQVSDYRVLTEFSAEVGQAAETGSAAERERGRLAYAARPWTAADSHRHAARTWAFVKANQPELVRLDRPAYASGNT